MCNMALPCRSKCERVRTPIWNCRPISGVDNAIQWYVTRRSMLCVNLKPKQVIKHIAVTWRSGTIDPRDVNPAGVNNHNSRHRLNPLRAKFLQREHKHAFTFCVISLHWYDAGTWNPSSSKTRTYLFYIVNIRTSPGHQQPWYWPS